MFKQEIKNKCQGRYSAGHEIIYKQAQGEIRKGSDMSIQEIIVAGSWLFAISTVITKNISGWFAMVSLVMAIIISAIFLN